MLISEQIFWLILLSIVVASVAWTVTQEEIFSEPREYCAEMSSKGENYFYQKVLLCFHLRILFQPLGNFIFSFIDRISTFN